MGTTKEAFEDNPVESTEVMWHWLREGWKYRGFNKKPKAFQKEAAERVKYEMGLMIDKDFLDYFLVLSDVVRQAKERGVAVGPARGSAAASLVCYLIRLTEVNPLDYPLMLFERFIDPNRFDLPDVDLDFEDERRDEVRQIMIEKYGADRVGNIGTFTRYRGKNSIDDVARVYQIPKFEVDAAKEFLVERSGGDSRFDASIEDTVAMFPVVQDLFNKYPDLNKAMELEGNYKSFGVHAAGLVVGAEPLWKYVATYGKDNVGKNKNSVQVLSVDKYDGEHLGLLKLDALGLQTMGMIADALKMLDMTLEELYEIPMSDPETLLAFNRADVMGIFQFEGRTAKMVTQQLKPDTFMDLAAVNALARPGPLHSGSTADYIAIRHGKMELEPIHPIVSKICETTEGQIIYQEQILQITREVGNFPWTHAAAIRRIISNKKGESAFNAMWDIFRDGSAENGVSEEVAREIWRRIATAGAYAFNIAHCVSYSMLGFWAMWLKVHHPLEFYAAQLHKVGDKNKGDNRVMLMRDMQDERFGRSYKVLPPSAEESGHTWKPVKGGVRAGFLQIPGVGERTAELIADFEKEVGITKWQDLTNIKGIGPMTVQKIQEFADNPDPFGINKIRDDIRAIKKFIAENPQEGIPMPRKLSTDIPYEAIKASQVIIGVIKNRQLQDLFEDHRARTGDDLDPKTIKDPHLKDSMTLYIEDTAGLMTVKIPRHLYPKYKEALWSIKLGEDYLVADAQKYPFLGKNVHIKTMWVINPD